MGVIAIGVPVWVSPAIDATVGAAVVASMALVMAHVVVTLALHLWRDFSKRWRE